MIQAKCIQKFRDNKGGIRSYRLQDLNGNIRDVPSDDLKKAIKKKQIHVVNLTLTSDNRLISKTEHVEPAKRGNDNYSNVAKALILLDKELLCMGDSFREIVSNRAFDAGYGYINVWDLSEFRKNPEYKDCKDDDEIIDKIAYKIYIKLVSTSPNHINAIIELWDECDSYDTFESNIKYEKVSKITQSKIYQALCIVYKHAKEHNYSNTAVKPLEEFLSKLR